MKINIKKLTETAILPERGSAYAAGYDLFADVKEVLEIAPHTTAMMIYLKDKYVSYTYI